MGTIAHAYESGGQTAREGIFSNLVLLTRVDGKVDPAETALLERIARKLSLTPEQAKDIMQSPEDFPMVPPVEKSDRFERFIQFIEMTNVDGHVDVSEKRMIARYGIALGFNESEAGAHTETILAKVQAGESSEAILKALI